MKFDFHAFLKILGLVAPVVLTAVPGGAAIAGLVPVIVSAIGEAEAIKGATGPEKKAHVLNVVSSAVAVANASGKVTLDPVQVQAVTGHGIDAVIGTLHVIEGAKVVKPEPPA